MKSYIISKNRKANFNYTIEESIETGIMLLGSEVKSLRTQSCSISEGHIYQDKGELWLAGVNIPIYKKTAKPEHDPCRLRKLLLHKKEISRLATKLKTKGVAIIPISIYSNERGKIKVKIALGKGKKIYDKRQDIKKRDWEREKSRILKDAK
ncbi:SsrA-binding protein [Rickettsiales bacterium]|nr:SsrA-binding protein [Rickettsiales bacterium]